MVQLLSVEASHLAPRFLGWYSNVDLHISRLVSIECPQRRPPPNSPPTGTCIKRMMRKHTQAAHLHQIHAEQRKQQQATHNTQQQQQRRQRQRQRQRQQKSVVNVFETRRNGRRSPLQRRPDANYEVILIQYFTVYAHIIPHKNTLS